MVDGKNYNRDILIERFLKTNGIYALRSREKLIEVVALVAKIPWGEGRTIQEVLVDKKVGTCTGKHLVLQACFDKLEIEYQPAVCTFRWGEQGINYPSALQAILNEGEWNHGHNFVQLKTGVDIDITWDAELAPFGFSVFPENWDGTSSFIGVKKIIQRWGGVDPVKKKKELVESLDSQTRERREKFLREFIAWIASLRK